MSRLVFLLVLAAAAGAEPQRQPWVGFELPETHEAAAVRTIESKGATVIAWSNALVDVSVFQGTEARPLATLGRTLSASDPRWDPWLRHLDSVFHPRPGTARLWVPASERDTAASALGGPRTEAGPVPPRGVTGWMVVVAALFYLSLRLAGQGWPQWRAGMRAWVWFPSTLIAVLAGALLVWGGPQGPVSVGAPSSPVSWERHRWYQEALPFGAVWDDWTSSKPWSYPTVERRNGKLVEEKVALPVPDIAWAKAAYDALEDHQAARIFGIGNP